MNATTVAAVPLGPLDPERSELLLRVVDGLDPGALQWLSGFAAGVAHERGHAGRFAASAVAAAPAPKAEPSARLAIVYGSQTGNGKRIAERLARSAESAGLAVRLAAAGAYPLRDLARERLLVVVISTHGDGEPPDDARGLVEFLESKRAPRLEQLSYAVLALGDSSYPRFCAAGAAVDERLAALGAKRLIDRADADVDFDRVANPWLDQVLGQARDTLGAQPVATVTRLRPVAAGPQHSREQPFAAEVIDNQRITSRSATRDVRHVELSLAGSGLAYEPGDALGVWHQNPPPVVDPVLAALRADGDAAIEHDGRSRPLRDWLTTEREITRLTRPLLARHAELSGDAELASVLVPGHEDALRRTLKDLQLVDLLQRNPGAWDAASLVAALRPLAPRLYSIASSPEVVGDEAHITVAVVEYRRDRQSRHGAASAYLAGLAGDARARIFIEPNERFRLPADGSRDVIMIGPGTGVAPFRGFLQHREARGDPGRNWLIFGARHFESEFLYQLEWQEAVRRGRLNRLDLAFSRDATPRAYVQDRLREAGKDLYAWLEGGASLYVCGDAEKMAPDVNAALVELVGRHGGLDRDGAEAYVRRLADERRYLRDVY